MLIHAGLYRFVWASADISFAQLGNQWLWIGWLIITGLVMIFVDFLMVFSKSKQDFEAAEKQLEQAEFWLTSWAGTAVKVVTFGMVKPEKKVRKEIRNAIGNAVKAMDQMLYSWLIQIALRFLFGFSAWAAWLICHSWSLNFNYSGERNKDRMLPELTSSILLWGQGNAGSKILGSLKSIWNDFLEHLPLLAGGVIVLLLTWVVSRVAVTIAERMLKRTDLRSSFKILCVQLTSLAVWILGILVAATIVFPGLTPAKALAVLGLGSVAIGFAFKDIFENFFAGVLILWRFPFDPGDFIECGDIVGKVEEIRIRMTLIRRVDGQLIIVPNAKLFKDPVDVLTSWRTRRVTVIAGVAYDEDVDESRSVIQKAVEECETVNKDKPIEIFAQEFASSSINFEVTWWTGPTPLEIRRSRDEIVSAVKKALDEAGIEIPFPYRTLTFKESLNVSQSGEE